MAIQYTFLKISEILQGEVLFNNAAQDKIVHLGYDSRILTNPAETIFFALKSKNHDGHLHLQECFLKGVRNFVVCDINAVESLPEETKTQSNFLYINDTTNALQSLTAWHREQFDLQVIGITGSNGKTVVKEWLNQLLQQDYSIVRSPKSFNSQIGVPLSVWQINDQHNLGIFEAGISYPGEMQKLEKIIQPTIGVFTNLGEAHQAHFQSLSQKAQEKLKLFANCQTIIYCKDYEVLEAEIQSQKKQPNWQNKAFLGWSTYGNGELQFKLSHKQNQTQVKGAFQGKDVEFLLPFTDKASVENALHCCVLMLYLGYDESTIQERILGLHALEMRLELKEGINGCTIINDSYSSDLQSLAIALDTLNQQNQHPQKTLILSDIFETGRNEESLYQEVAQLLNQKQIHNFIGIGSALTRQSHLLPDSSKFYISTEEFLRAFSTDDFHNQAILIKGSRAFTFEKIARKLQRKAHITELQINLSALIHNLNVYRGLLKPKTKVMAMVKAFSYGSGSFEIANILQFHKVDYLAVAYADEGVFLRQHGITLPIVVMSPEESAFETIIQNKLEPEIYSLQILKGFTKALHIFAPEKMPYPVHLKVDTGMYRLGFVSENTEELLQELKEDKSLKIASVFSHLASADVPEHDEFTNKQIAGFEDFANKIEETVGYKPMRHILNSSGIVRFPQAHYDMVRLGLGLYGLDPTSKISSQLETVSTLKTHITQIKTLQAGESVGYSRKGIVDRKSNIAILGIGYADGFPRALGNGVGEVLIHGKRAPLIGNICMDMCMVDVTAVPNVQEGDEVILFGKDLTIEEMADWLQTIPYEVLTNVSQRVKRVYFKE
ncbi:MAG: bifunctional UDP-N-acetylmuramoyl-tripeptide:D-alanyl-D-alanine ligase/alanine racemase [Bacteroidia bacterium]